MSAFDKIFKTCAKWCVKHSVEIAMTGAIVGVGLTVFTTSRATLAIDSIVKEEDLSKKEKVKLSIKPALPAAASVIFATASIAAMYHFGKKKQAALLGLLISTQQVFNKYRQNERVKVGIKDEAEMYADAREDSGFSKSVPDIPKKNDEIMFCESVTGQYFTAKEADIYKAMYLANRQFALAGELEFNDWLGYIDCDDEEMIYGYGWDQTQGWEFFGYQFIDFVLVTRKDKDGKEYKLITYPFLPHLLEGEDIEGDHDWEILCPSVDTDLWKKLSSEEKEEIIQKQIVKVSHP